MRELLSNMPNCCVCAGEFCSYLFTGMHDRSMQSGTELTWEIQLNDWSTAEEQGKLVFVVSTKPSLALFTT